MLCKALTCDQNLPMNKFLQAILLLAIVCITSCKPNVNPKAVELNKKAFKILLFDPNYVLSDEERSKTALAILDSATALEPAYNSAYINKLSSLIILKRYKEALNTINIVLKNDPESFNTHIKGGVIARDYLQNEPLAIKYFTKANQLATESAKGNSYYHVTFSLVYLKGKAAALDYLNEVKARYANNQKALDDIKFFQKLLEQRPVNKQENMNWFTSYSTIDY
jgi:tetratricopeptide (TPR) repeat protein